VAEKPFELNLEHLPKGYLRHYRRSVCLACIFGIYTKQLKLTPRTAYSEAKRYEPTIAELTGSPPTRPFFPLEPGNPRCPYCASAKRSHATFDTWRVEGGSATDAARRALVKSLPKTGDPFQVLERKTTRREAFFGWLDGLGRKLDLDGDEWLMEVAREYLERREPSGKWAAVFRDIRGIRPSGRLENGWASEDGRLYLVPRVYNEILVAQYLVSRSHKHGGGTFQGRLTLLELVRRLRHVGYFRQAGILEEDPFELLEKLIDHLSGGEQPVKLHYIVDRRDFLAKLKSVYSRYG